MTKTRKRDVVKSPDLTLAIVNAIRDGVADAIERLMVTPGVTITSDILQAIEDGTARGVQSLVEKDMLKSEKRRGKN